MMKHNLHSRDLSLGFPLFHFFIRGYEVDGLLQKPNAGNSLFSYTVLFHMDGLDLTMTTDCESVGRPASFLRLLRHSLMLLFTVYAHIL